MSVLLDRETCPLHGEKMWADCWNCGGEGYIELYDDDPLWYDDDPLWYDEDDIETCDVCRGKGGWYICATCHPESVDDL